MSVFSFPPIGISSTFLIGAAATIASAAAQCSRAWLPMGVGTDSRVHALATLPNGDLVAGGLFTTAGGVSASCIARWDGANWWPLGSGVSGAPFPTGPVVSAMRVLANGDLVAGGVFSDAGGVSAASIARWDGATWSSLGATTVVRVNALATLPNGDLVAGGAYVILGSSPQHIARWDGATWWPLGSGVNSYDVRALATLPNGDLVAGGNFTAAGGVSAYCIARWNGSNWSSMGSGMGGGVLGTYVSALATLPNGDLVAGGNFTTAGGVSANFVARWNGSSWSPLGSGMTGPTFLTEVRALAMLPNGDLVAGGTFTTAGGVPASHLARWNGATWSAFDPGTDGGVNALATRAVGDLVLGGEFATAGGAGANCVAVLTTTCPAAAASYGAGCVGSAGMTALAAAQLPWLGGTFRATATGLPPDALAVAVFGFGQLSLPMPAVHPLGTSGCTLLVTDEILLQFQNASGSVMTHLAIPDVMSLGGAVFHHQVVPIEFDALGNLAALTSTNGLTLTIGAW